MQYNMKIKWNHAKFHVIEKSYHPSRSHKQLLVPLRNPSSMLRGTRRFLSVGTQITGSVWDIKYRPHVVPLKLPHHPHISHLVPMCFPEGYLIIPFYPIWVTLDSLNINTSQILSAQSINQSITKALVAAELLQG